MTKSEKAILKSAKTLFWKFGLKKVTVEQICEHAGVSKMTFYRKYPNKEHAAELVLLEILENNLAKYHEIMALEIPFPEKVNQLLLLKHQESHSISPAFIQEILTEDDSSLHQMVQSFTEKSYTAMLQDFEKAKLEGWIRPEIKSKFILSMLAMLKTKMLDAEFMSLYSSAEEAIMELSNFFFYGLFKKR